MLLSNTPVVVNPYNVSSLAFEVGPLTDISNDFTLRQKEWPNFLPNIANSPPKKFAFYKEINVDSNPYLCFQNVVIQKAPNPAAFMPASDAAESPSMTTSSKSGSRYG